MFQHRSRRPDVRRPARRRAVLATAVLSCGVLALSGCKSAVDESGEGSDKPVRGGTLTIVQSADIAPSTFLSQNNPNFSIIRTVFNTLTAYDHKTLEPQPRAGHELGDVATTGPRSPSSCARA